MVIDKIKKVRLDDRIKLEVDNWESCINDIKPFFPLNVKSIPHFVEWINFNKFANDHHALDFAAYLNKFGEAVLGLPQKTSVHAITDGIVVGVERRKVMEGVIDPYDHYLDTLLVAHGKSPKNKITPSLVGVYAHINTKLKEGQYLSRGQKIGNLYADGGYFGRGRLVHLHFGLVNYNAELNYEDPEILFPGLMKLTAYPQRNPDFNILEREGKTDLRLANFPVLSYGNTDLEKHIRNKEFTAPKPTYSLRERIRELIKK